jgi:hypothetical protein
MNSQNEPLFQPEDVISIYSDADAVEDGILVAVTKKDRVSVAVFEYLAKNTPLGAEPPANWPVDLMGWFQADKVSKTEALKIVAEHGKDAQEKFEEKVRDNKALALAKGIIGRDASTAKRIYDANIGGGIYALYPKVENGKFTVLETEQDGDGGEKFWIVPNELGGVTLMLPSDY